MFCALAVERWEIISFPRLLNRLLSIKLLFDRDPGNRAVWSCQNALSNVGYGVICYPSEQQRQQDAGQISFLEKVHHIVVIFSITPRKQPMN